MTLKNQQRTVTRRAAKRKRAIRFKETEQDVLHRMIQTLRRTGDLGVNPLDRKRVRA